MMPALFPVSKQSITSNRAACRGYGFPVLSIYRYDPPPPIADAKGPIRFGYFGDFRNRQVRQLVNAFLKADPGTLHICGHGPLSGELKQLAERHPNFQFDGFLPKQSDCFPGRKKWMFSSTCGLPGRGKDNSAPSKVFEYGVAGKAILSTRTAGMDEILGNEGIYIETENFEDSLRPKIAGGFRHGPDGTPAPGDDYSRADCRRITVGRNSRDSFWNF